MGSEGKAGEALRDPEGKEGHRPIPVGLHDVLGDEGLVCGPVLVVLQVVERFLGEILHGLKGEEDSRTKEKGRRPKISTDSLPWASQ